MSLLEILCISIGLAMDAFAISICKGLSMKKISIKSCIIVGLYFTSVHVITPLIGYLLGSSFEKIIASIDHWVAFILLLIIGFNMIREALSKDKENYDDRLDFKTMFPLLIATSIDTLSTGISFAFLKVNILLTVGLIGIITFILSFIGLIIGNKFGNKYADKAQLIGGIILILIGIKILLEHLGFI